MEDLSLHWIDLTAFVLFFVILSAIGFWAGRGEQKTSTDYFLAGRKLPWYVVGGSFIATTISTEHLIGMVGAAYIYGATISLWSWGNIEGWTFVIFLFIPFLMRSKVFTIPEFLERRYNNTLRQFFAIVAILANVTIFMAAVLYGGGIAIHEFFGVDLIVAIVALGFVAGIWAIYGGLSSVAWTDLFTVFVIFVGGCTITILGLLALAGEGGNILDGFSTMIELNQAKEGVWAEAVETHQAKMTSEESYNRLAAFQPYDHPVSPWTSRITIVISVSIWYNVLNQFVIQRVLGARNIYHARMGFVMAGFLQLLLPLIVVVPGLIFFAMNPEILLGEWSTVQTEADKSYIRMLQALIPVGLKGLFLAALFGAIQSTVNSVLNATGTIFTRDIYQRMIKPDATDAQVVRVGVISSAVALVIGIILALLVSNVGQGLFTYIHTMNAIFAPPFAAVFLLGIFWKRANAQGAIAGVVAGFIVAVGFKLAVYQFGDVIPEWLHRFPNQAGIVWACSMVTATLVSLLTPPPLPEKTTVETMIVWKELALGDGLGTRWYKHVGFLWIICWVVLIALLLYFSPVFFPIGG